MSLGTFVFIHLVRVEFPAQGLFVWLTLGYVNPQNTTLEFDVSLITTNSVDTESYFVRFQNNIQSIFSRVRLLYGATPIEDIINYNVIVRNLTEWTGTNQEMAMDQTSIADGVGGTTFGIIKTSSSATSINPVNARQTAIQGVDLMKSTISTVSSSLGTGWVPNKSAGATQSITTRRYQINFALGLFTQDKLVIWAWLI